MSYPIDVTAKGAVLLGEGVSCDGFRIDRALRVQTHLHMDHMDGFSYSKGFQDILLSHATHDLLCTELNADLPYRENLIRVSSGESIDVNGTRVSLVPSGHMLGAVQAAVETSSGQSLGYSGDFQWPLDEVITVEALVVDSTYGNPQSVRKYSQAECEEQFIDLIRRQLADGPVHLLAHRGTLERALQLLSGNLDYPMVGSSPICRYADVYRSYGYIIDSIIELSSDESTIAMQDGSYLRIYGTGDSSPLDINLGSSVKLSAYFTRPESSILQYSKRSYCVALSGHADFNGTIEYVVATGAKYVVADNSRGGNGVQLALELSSRLGIEARPSANAYTQEWGY